MIKLCVNIFLCILLVSCSPENGSDKRIFTVAVIPDTQNYLDYTHQKSEGFSLDASDQFLSQMKYIAEHSFNNGGDIVFAIHLGDVWQHQTIQMDEEHRAEGFEAIPNKWLAGHVFPAPDQVFGFEVPMAKEGFRILSEANIPFGVVPGNHDYDAMWSAAGWPPTDDPKKLTMSIEALGRLHAGGLNTFRAVFGEKSEFFENKDWYVESYDGGTNSAQIFEAGGYQFLHLALEMSPMDDILSWASSVLKKYDGLPTIVTTHDYLSASSEKKSVPIIDFHAVDARHNNAQMLWDKLISQHSQIFMVLSGHQHGQGLLIEKNDFGGKVYQIMADYQDRGQSGIDAGQPIDPYTGRPVGIGDGWMRLMTFDFSGSVPFVEVSTYSSHYLVDANHLDNYAAWYRRLEQPNMTDDEFLKADSYTLELDDFYSRFGSSSGL